MAKYAITTEARDDLKDIGRFSQQTWGRMQRIKYLAQLESRFRDLARERVKGRLRDDLPGAPMSFHVGRHVIFYRHRNDGIEILRVLHDAMDFSRYFK